MTTKKAATFFWILVTLIPILGIIFSLINPQEFSGLQETSQKWIGSFGVFGPLVFVIVQILQVVITPISHYSVSVVGGYLYGPYIGGGLNYIGRMIGHIVAFIIARRFGRDLIEKYVDQKTLEKYDSIIAGNKDAGDKGTIQSFILFLIYFLPLFPDDEISYMVGASRMSQKQFLLANIFGQLGGSFGLAYIGSGINEKDLFLWVMLGLSLLGFIAFGFLARAQKK